MKKSIPAVAFLIFALHAASALEIEETELRSVQANQDSVQFENYGGPHAVVETADAIINIGTELGVQVAADASNPLSVNPQGKYSVYHVVNSEETSGLDADIFFINSTAMVDHINNVRRILTGYLMAAYGYERADAETIAIFITVYNAVYRGNLSSFSGKYKNAVLVNLTEESVGLSTNWEDWAGSTQIVIPLYNGGAGEPAVVETSVISDENVIEALRQEDDKSVDLRENLVGIKEQEAQDYGEKAKESQKEAAQERKDGNAEKAAESAKNATEQQKRADKKTEEARSERQTIEKDKQDSQKEAISKQDVGENRVYLTSLFIADEKNRLYSLMTVNPQNGEVVKKSALRQIREKTIYPVSKVTVQKDDGTSRTFDELFVAVCGVTDKRSAVKLCLIDAENLEIQKQSAETLSETSPLVQQGDTFYVIISEGGNAYVASYDKNLSLKKKSSVAINGASPLNLFEQGIVVTDTKGNPVLLGLANLEPVW